MKRIAFSKYQGTGNDFILIDNRTGVVHREDIHLIKKLCDRKFGIGSDGLILIERHPEYDFDMVYFNPDGSQSLCGNGSRCAVKFALSLGIIGSETTFLTIEGPLFAKVKGKLIHLRMPDVVGLSSTLQNDLFLNTGSPHYVRFVHHVRDVNVYQEGKAIRYHEEFSPSGTNVNFVERGSRPDHIIVRTYERGVENETLSCGTGVTASALAAGSGMKSGKIHVNTLGGNLEVHFEQVEKGVYRDIYLIGPAEKVFEGTIEV